MILPDSRRYRSRSGWRVIRWNLPEKIRDVTTPKDPTRQRWHHRGTSVAAKLLLPGQRIALEELESLVRLHDGVHSVATHRADPAAGPKLDRRNQPTPFVENIVPNRL